MKTSFENSFVHCIDKLYIMKKLLLLLLLVPMVSCSSDDDNTRITDPLIGIWEGTYEGGNDTLTVNPNGTFMFLYEYDDDTDDDTASGEWSNSASDFTSFGQTYAISFEDYPEDDEDDPGYGVFYIRQ